MDTCYQIKGAYSQRRNLLPSSPPWFSPHNSSRPSHRLRNTTVTSTLITPHNETCNDGTILKVINVFLAACQTFSKCCSGNRAAVAKNFIAKKAEIGTSETKAFTPQANSSSALPLCSAKPVSTPQMRQSKVWEDSPKIGVRHIHFSLSLFNPLEVQSRKKNKKTKEGRKKWKGKKKRKKSQLSTHSL